MFLVVERIDDEAKLIVVNSLAATKTCPNTTPIRIEAEANNVEVLVGISHEGNGFLRNWRSILRIALLETLNFEHFVGYGWQGIQAQEIVDCGCLVKVRKVEWSKCRRVGGGIVLRLRQRTCKQERKQQRGCKPGAPLHLGRTTHRVPWQYPHHSSGHGFRLHHGYLRESLSVSPETSAPFPETCNLFR